MALKDSLTKGTWNCGTRARRSLLQIPTSPSKIQFRLIKLYWSQSKTPVKRSLKPDTSAAFVGELIQSAVRRKSFEKSVRRLVFPPIYGCVIALRPSRPPSSLFFFPLSRLLFYFVVCSAFPTSSTCRRDERTRWCPSAVRAQTGTLASAIA